MGAAALSRTALGCMLMAAVLLSACDRPEVAACKKFVTAELGDRAHLSGEAMVSDQPTDRAGLLKAIVLKRPSALTRERLQILDDRGDLGLRRVFVSGEVDGVSAGGKMIGMCLFPTVNGELAEDPVEAANRSIGNIALRDASLTLAGLPGGELKRELAKVERPVHPCCWP